MTEKTETINDLLAEYRSDLLKFKEDLAFHIKEDHHGYPASTCHRCLNYVQGILDREDSINYLLKKQNPA
ncbi:MAG TPA: hypothetical protein PLI45_04965 [Candidatus Woesebacteria bacterium]|nr:hypothetical protein [Candidatus Woesebacteria bacterium]